MTTVITDRSEAVDSLLMSRKSIADVRNSTLPGQPLYLAVERAIVAVDEAISAIRDLR